MKKYLFALIVALLFTGCGVGSLVAMPFKVTGAVVNVVTPKVVGNTIAGAGEVIEDTIPF